MKEPIEEQTSLRDLPPPSYEQNLLLNVSQPSSMEEVSRLLGDDCYTFRDEQRLCGRPAGRR